MNLLFKQGDISYSEANIIKKLGNSKSISFPNKRIDRVITNPSEHFEFLFNSYCLENINFNENDTVIDYAVQMLESYFTLLTTEISKINYIGFEPDVEAYDCLEKTWKNMILLYITLHYLMILKKVFYILTQKGQIAH